MELYYLDAETQLAKYVFCKNSLTFPHTYVIVLRLVKWIKY